MGAEDKEKSKPAKTEAAAADPFKVPDAGPAELLDFIERVLKLRPTESEYELGNAFRIKQCKAMLAAADRILAGKPDEEQAETAVQYRLRSLAMLEQMGDTEAPKLLAAFPDDLEKAGRAALARQVRRPLLQMRLYKAFSASSEELNKAIDEVKQFIGKSPQASDLELVFMATQMLEMKGPAEQAANAYREFGKLYAASEDKMLASVGARMEGAARRVTLLGKPMKIEGKLVDGQPLKWADYHGKVVLVMFWATWCGPCRAELPEIKECYDAYHARGFEVLGISCDNDRHDLEGFLKEQEIPWKTLFSDEAKSTGMNNPMADYYGIVGVPTLMLVGKDGKVVSMSLRGPKLREELAKVLGPITEVKEKKTAPTPN
jgi:thiol-disulfide isomerase/thioredoxin